MAVPITDRHIKITNQKVTIATHHKLITIATHHKPKTTTETTSVTLIITHHQITHHNCPINITHHKYQTATHCNPWAQKQQLMVKDVYILVLGTKKLGSIIARLTRKALGISVVGLMREGSVGSLRG